MNKAMSPVGGVDIFSVVTEDKYPCVRQHPRLLYCRLELETYMTINVTLIPTAEVRRRLQRDLAKGMEIPYLSHFILDDTRTWMP